MVPSQVIKNYESLSTLTAQMREAAELGEWDQLIGCEHQRSELVSVMRPVDAEVVLDEASRQRKMELIAGIMAVDAEIREHIQVWMSQLQQTMQSNRQERLLLKAYGA